ncbi:MAG: hypothetical protein IJ390_07595 [Lachnospiraceae bacterium]|nr:hypothetical protein [Lachnospiraceae bacterium]
MEKRRDQTRGSGKFAVKSVILIILELIICGSLFSGAESDLKYGIEHEVSPLILTELSLKNCTDQAQDYDLNEGDFLVELTATYKNVGAYTGTYQNWLEFSCPDDEYGCYQAYSLADYELRYSDNYTQVIPAGMTGSFRTMLVVKAGEDKIIVEESGEKLLEKKKEVTMEVPKKVGDSIMVSFE